MRSIRRCRRLSHHLFWVCGCILAGLSGLFFIHSIWCATKSICIHRFLCARRQIVLYSNLRIIEDNQQSLCSIRAMNRGPHQRVIGVSAYLSNRDNKKLLPKLKTYLVQYLEEAQVKYPDWIVRVYYYSLNISNEEILRLEHDYKNVDFCDSTNLPLLRNVLRWLPGKMQRFLPLFDPLVDIYMSRDIDSPILDRETTIIQTWLDSKHTIHIIRDHPQHTIPILGGLWGIKVHQERALMNNLSQYMLSPDVVQCYGGEHDQTFLGDYLWPYANMYNTKTLEYDSFFCKEYPNSRSFPTQRESPTRFVGCRRPNCTGDEHPPCPKKCRPVNHQDWIWC